ncbi:glycosyl hydrolase [Bradyrhizobium sp. SZCCHNS2005]|uniref:glycoside hydrolase family 19 protein n=1 Tax=Bradyrhizobium sp. SZCCHNS2005 TaxID=3057303 RepID=UPI0028EE5480|nr:glycosyl hydrolase [Bradyrhizobium sp. SZCCHNS2005]
MTIKIDAASIKQIFPRAPQEVIDAFASKQAALDAAGITHTRTRLTDFFANIDHECAGFALKGLTENINYTAERMAAVWPNRFKNAAAVVAKYGSAPGWQKRAFDDIYGNRMGNRPGTHDGSTYIGRGGPQWTGRDGYAALAQRTGHPAVETPDVATNLDKQPEVCAAFWAWKNLNPKADVGDFTGLVKIWNGGTNGLAERKANVARIAPIVARMEGSPPTATPPADVYAAATRKERAGVAAAAAATVTTSVGATSPQPALPKVASVVGIGFGIVAMVAAIVLIARKKQAVLANWL